MTGEVPYLPGYDIIAVSSSGGKDSQTALDVVASLAMSEGILVDDIFARLNPEVLLGGKPEV